MKTVSFQKTAPVVGNYDVIVCGGGPAGFIAAITAAREGAKTTLVERYSFLGGMATAGYVTPISVFTYNGELVIGGIPWEFVGRLEEMGGALVEKPLGNVAFDPELYKLCARRMADEAGVDLYMNSYISGCLAQDGRIDHLIIENKNGTEALSAKIFIDATGDGDLAAMAGVPMQSMNSEPLQPASMCFILSGVDTSSKVVGEAMHHNKQGVNCHCLPIRERMLELMKEEELPNFGGPWFCTVLREGCVAVNMTRTAADACDNRGFTAAEARLREDVFRLTEVLRRHFPEFKNCRVASTGVQAGPRETRRIKGVHTITAEEYLTAYRYEDSVSRGAHPIDIHSDKQGEQNIRFLEKPAFVPYRALIAEGFPNLLIAGRCISAERPAFASLRVQASCMGTGQAAGAAAAQCAAENRSVLQADIPKLVERLKELGAVL